MTWAASALSFGVALWLFAIGGPSELPRYGLLGPLVSLLAHTFVAVTPASDFVPFGLANGAAFGALLGGALNWLSWTAAAAVHWQLAQDASGHPALAARLGGLPRRLRQLPVDHPLFLIAGRWVPLGAFFTNLAAGAGGVARSRLVLCAAVGSLPPALLVAAAGAGLFRWWAGA